jgi:predicted membrane channel-forming protein YqfA (hemolysin III family)
MNWYEINIYLVATITLVLLLATIINLYINDELKQDNQKSYLVMTLSIGALIVFLFVSNLHLMHNDLKQEFQRFKWKQIGRLVRNCKDVACIKQIFEDCDEEGEFKLIINDCNKKCNI